MVRALKASAAWKFDLHTEGIGENRLTEAMVIVRTMRRSEGVFAKLFTEGISNGGIVLNVSSANTVV